MYILIETLVMTHVPGLADSGDHLVHHGGAVSGLGNAGRRTGGVGAGDDGVVNVSTVADTGSGEDQDVLVDTEVVLQFYFPTSNV